MTMVLVPDEALRAARDLERARRRCCLDILVKNSPMPNETSQIRAEIDLLADTAEGLEVTMTTKRSLLARKLAVLRTAGLHRLNVRLDALDESTFRAMNDVDISAAEVLKKPPMAVF